MCRLASTGRQSTHTLGCGVAHRAKQNCHGKAECRWLSSCEVFHVMLCCIYLYIQVKIMWDSRFCKFLQHLMRDHLTTKIAIVKVNVRYSGTAVMTAITIRDVQVILTQPQGQRLVVVKIITSEPGLYRLGCATVTQRFRAVHAATQHPLKPSLIRRDVHRIEDIWQMAMVNGYWRNGPVLGNAISGADMALWDIKGKLANMPVYQLLGGKCREAAAVYVHADGRDAQEVIENAQRFIEQGYRYIRVQMGGYGGKHARDLRPQGALDGAYYDPRAYVRKMLKMIETVRAAFGDEIDLLHDIHERLQPIDAVNFAKAVEPFNLFFLEDALAPEDIEWFTHIHAVCTTPLAMGELFNNPLEWRSLIERRLIDFLRMHISQMGGITPARNAAI